jgi:hypothetical protein
MLPYMAKLRRLKGEVQLHSTYKTPRIIRNIPSELSNENPRKIAESTLMKIAPDLKIRSDLSDLKFDKVKKTVLGSHVLYQQYLDSKPISGSWIRVDIDKKGKVYNIQSDLVPKSFILKVKPKERQKTAKLSKRKVLSSDDVTSLALKAAGSRKTSENKLLKKEQVYFPYKGVPTLAWKVIVETIRPRKEMKMYLDAISGKVLSKFNQLRERIGKGLVFDPNPVVTLNDITLKENSTIPNSAYKTVSLNGLKGNGVLDGAFVSTKNTKRRIKRNDNKFLFTRRDRPFKEVMAYFHIDRMQRYIQELGFDNAMNHSISVDIAGRTDDNSDYSPERKSLRFGTGGVDDAEDAEIILHEYGHAILDDQVPGFGETKEAASISEAFGDYVAASFFEGSKTPILKPTIGTWDAVGYSSRPPRDSVRCLRRLDGKKRYPRDLSSPFDPHLDGEIWSACLWELRKLLGRKIADKLIIAHHFLLTRKATFNDAANAMILANRNLNRGAKEANIKKIFTTHGIL